MKRREGYKRIAIRVAEQGVYVEHTLSTPKSMESARKVVGVLFLFYGHLLCKLLHTNARSLHSSYDE